MLVSTNITLYSQCYVLLGEGIGNAKLMSHCVACWDGGTIVGGSRSDGEGRERKLNRHHFVYASF